MAENVFSVVIGVDFSETSQEAMREAFRQVKQRTDEQTHVHAVVVVDDSAHGLSKRRAATALEGAVEAARTELTEVTTAVRKLILGDGEGARKVPVTVHVRIGNPVDQIVSVATEVAAHLIVVGTHGRRGVRRWVMGSVAERVARTAPCPVLVVRPRDLAAFAAVPSPEPPPPEGLPPPEVVESHRYGYSSSLEPQPPPFHLL